MSTQGGDYFVEGNGLGAFLRLFRRQRSGRDAGWGEGGDLVLANAVDLQAAVLGEHADWELV